MCDHVIQRRMYILRLIVINRIIRKTLSLIDHNVIHQIFAINNIVIQIIVINRAQKWVVIAVRQSILCHLIGKEVLLCTTECNSDSHKQHKKHPKFYSISFVYRHLSVRCHETLLLFPLPYF